MDILLFISQFLYRIRYRILWGSLIVTGLVIYFTQFLPYSYSVKGSIYTGVSTQTSLDGTSSNYAAIASSFDNLINIGKSQQTLQEVSLRLLANALTYGQEWDDNRFIQAKHYRQLIEMAPREVLALADRKDVNKTLEKLRAYKKEDRYNFVYRMLNSGVQFYSLSALDGLDIRRAGNSDILHISYTSADPGMTQQTVEFLIEELRKAYEILRFKATNDVIAFFEEQVRITKKKLDDVEDDLMHYNVAQQVINYGEETKALAGTKYEVEDRFEEAERIYQGAVSLRKMLDERMDIRANIIRNNSALLQELNKVSSLNQQIMEKEIFTNSDPEVTQREREDLARTEQRISQISDSLNKFSFTKEGVGIEDMVNEWLAACVNEAKAKAELDVLKRRQENIIEQYAQMSPIGTQVNRKERAIGIAEDNYRVQLDGLAKANLRLKNIEMSTSNLQVVAPPPYPLSDNGRNRMMYVLVAFVGSILFIITFCLIIEVLDRTLRDTYRSQRLSGLPVIAAFNGISNLKYRGFLKACNRKAAAYSCRRLNTYLRPGETSVINLFSINPREGKSFLAKYFADYWRQEGLTVRIVDHKIDFIVQSKSYEQAKCLSDFWVKNEAESTPDIVIVEYPSMAEAGLPIAVLQQADVNLLIANAQRLWRDSDTTIISPIKERLKDNHFMLYLNNADREVVESFTGELPPKLPVHSFISRLAQFGLTSQKPAVK